MMHVQEPLPPPHPHLSARTTLASLSTKEIPTGTAFGLPRWHRAAARPTRSERDALGHVASVLESQWPRLSPHPHLSARTTLASSSTKEIPTETAFGLPRWHRAAAGAKRSKRDALTHVANVLESQWPRLSARMTLTSPSTKEIPTETVSGFC